VADRPASSQGHASATRTPAPPPEVVALVQELERAGHEAWCVGGGVRDALLGHPSMDWDLATSATPAEVQRVFRRTVPVGIEHGTVGVFDRAGRLHEVTTFRRDVRTDGRHAEVAFGVSLDDDLARRDFTINAMAWHPVRGELRDPFGGQADLRDRLLRAVGDPAARMREDRLRALRAIRFASRFGLRVHPDTWAAVQDSAAHLGRLSAERVRQELEKTFEQVRRPSDALLRWREAGALKALLPALDAAPPEALLASDVLPVPGLAGRPGRRLARVSAVLAPLGAEAERVARDLRMSNLDVSWIGSLARAWASIGSAVGEAARSGTLTDTQLRRWAAALGRPKALPFLRVAAGVWAAQARLSGAVPSDRDVRLLYRRMARVAWHDPIEVADLALDGEDLRQAGVAPGPAMGATLRRLLDHVLEDPSRNTRDALLALVREMPA
jgi:tRNA nucleotidyltransferase (CCA-adding enzyme)